MTSFLGVPVRIREQGLRQPLPHREGRRRRLHRRRTRRSWSRSPPRPASPSRTPGCYEEAARRQRWLAATAEITALLTAAIGADDALQAIADRAREVAGADVAWIVTGAGRDASLMRTSSRGSRRTRTRCARSLWSIRWPGAVVGTGRSGRGRGHRRPTRGPSMSPQVLGWPSLGPAVVVPLGSGRAGRRRARPGVAAGNAPSSTPPCRPGAAGQLRRAGDPGPPGRRGRARTSSGWRCSRTATGSAATCTTWSSSGCSRSAWRCRATAAAWPIPTGGRAARRRRSTTSTRRSRTSAGRSSRSGQHGRLADIQAEVTRLVDRAAGTLKFRPTLQFEGPVRTLVGGDVAPDVLAVLGEALSNASRHAGAPVGRRAAQRRRARSC